MDDAAPLPDPLDAPLELRAARIVMAPPPLDRRAPITQGGVLVPGQDLGDLELLDERIAAWRERAPHPLVVAADAEPGLLHRLGLPEDLPDAATWTVDDAARVGQVVGRALKDAGVDIAFAPVLDVAESGFMARTGRAIPGGRDRVIAIGGAYARGLRAGGVLAIGKHFPGYGDAEASTDRGPVRMAWSPPELAWHVGAFEAVAPDLDGLLLSNQAYDASGVGGEWPVLADPVLVGRAHAIAPFVFTDDLAAATRGYATPRDPDLVVVAALLAGADVLVTAAPRDLARVRGGWAYADPAGALARWFEAHPDQEPILDAAVCRVWDIARRAGRAEGECSSEPGWD